MEVLEPNGLYEVDYVKKFISITLLMILKMLKIDFQKMK